MKSKRRICGWALWWALLGCQVAVADEQLLASIKPLQLIAVAIADEPAAVGLLLDPRRPHHEYQLRPSERRRLEQAGVILWVGPDLETFLQRPLATLPGSVQVVTLLPRQGEGGHSADHHHSHDHADAHIWLDPEQAIAIGRRVADVLSERIPEQRQRWQRNAERFAAELRAVDQALRTELAGKRLRPYLVMHDAYGHFEASHGLRRAATLTATPEQQPGARHLFEIRRQFERNAIRCVFREPQYDTKSLQLLLREYSPRVGTLDPMAISAPVTRTGFVEFYREFGQAVAACLEE